MADARSATPNAIRLADYRRPGFEIETVELTFELDPAATRVHARLEIRRVGDDDAPLVLDGDGLNTVRVVLDGE
jgi:aminopeptidase N